MSDLWFTEAHEWLRMESHAVGVVGITEYAQEQLGELVYVELPQANVEFARGAEMAVIESVKAASELFAPVSGKVLEINAAVVEDPSLVNSDPLGDGWMVKIALTVPGETANLMDASRYAAFIAGLE